MSESAILESQDGEVTHRIVPGYILDLTFTRNIFKSINDRYPCYIDQCILNFEPKYHMSIIQESAWKDKDIFEIALLDPKTGSFQSHRILDPHELNDTTIRCKRDRIDFYILEIMKEIGSKRRPDHLHHNAYI